MVSQQFRTHSRFFVEVAVKLEAAGRNVVASGTIVNLGMGGAACRSNVPFRMGEEINITILTNEPQASRSEILHGDIAWVAWGESTEVRLGIRFFPECREQVAELIDGLVSPADVGT